MADAVATQTIIDGSRNAVMKFTNISDATGETAVTKVTASSLSGAPTNLKINKVHFATFGMGVDILWDATADVLAWHIPENQVGCFDFTPFGGLINNAGAGVTGNIQFTTLGAAAGDRYSIILELAKS
jgi:hypothetical protein